VSLVELPKSNPDLHSRAYWLSHAVLECSYMGGLRRRVWLELHFVANECQKSCVGNAA
jgi:hypothetical protein